MLFHGLFGIVLFLCLVGIFHSFRSLVASLGDLFLKMKLKRFRGCFLFFLLRAPTVFCEKFRRFHAVRC